MNALDGFSPSPATAAVHVLFSAGAELVWAAERCMHHIAYKVQSICYWL